MHRGDGRLWNIENIMALPTCHLKNSTFQHQSAKPAYHLQRWAYPSLIICVICAPMHLVVVQNLSQRFSLCEGCCSNWCCRGNWGDDCVALALRLMCPMLNIIMLLSKSTTQRINTKTTPTNNHTMMYYNEYKVRIPKKCL